MKIKLYSLWVMAAVVLQGQAALSGVLVIDNMEGGPKSALPVASGGILVIDNMDGTVSGPALAKQPEFLANPSTGESREPVDTNSLGARTGVYQQEPSSAEFGKAESYGKNGAGLKISYNKKNKGGPKGDGGFCGYYTLLHSGPTDYLDVSTYKYLTFWVRGMRGDEKFRVGATDKKWALIGDSIKSKEIGQYLPAGKITAEWQRAEIPLLEFRVDWTQMHSIAICFDGNLFNEGSGQGTVFIDDLEFTREKPGANP